MKVVFIGAGNVATHLAKELYKYNFDIVQVYSRTMQSAQQLADAVGAIATTTLSDIATDADIYLFSVKDDALPRIILQMPANNGIWVHTAGSIPLNVFETKASRYGVLYPLQTFSRGREVDWKSIPIFVEAATEGDLNILIAIALQLSDKVAPLSSDKRRFLHLTGVLACNFVNHMYALSADMLHKADLPFDVTLPLIDETAAKVHSMSPADAQTGPAVRFDCNVMDAHMAIIEDQRVKEIYRLISESIHEKSLKNRI